MFALNKSTTNLRWDKELGLTVRPEFVEGWAVKPFMARQINKLSIHYQGKLKVSVRPKLVAGYHQRLLVES